MHILFKLLIILLPLLFLITVLWALSKWQEKNNSRKLKERKEAVARALADTYADVNRKPLFPSPLEELEMDADVRREIAKTRRQKAQSRKRSVRDRESSRNREFEEDAYDIQKVVILDLFRRDTQPANESPPSFESSSHDLSSSHSHDSHSSSHDSMSSHDSSSFDGGGSSGGDW